MGQEARGGTCIQDLGLAPAKFRVREKKMVQHDTLPHSELVAGVLPKTSNAV